MSGRIQSGTSRHDNLILPVCDSAWLSPLLHADLVAAALNRVVRPGEKAVRKCAVRHVRYRPGASCTVLYDVWQESDGPDEAFLVYARCLAPGRGQALLDDGVRRTTGSMSRLLPAPTRLPGTAAVVREFPDDATMPALAAVLDEDLLARGLVTALAVTGSAATDVQAKFKHLRYKPEHRLILRADLTWRERGDTRPTGHTCQVRFEYGADQERRSDLAAQLSRTLPSPGFLLPPGHERTLHDLGCTVVPWRAGADLGDGFRRGDVQAAACAGRVLASLGGIRLQGLKSHSAADARQEAEGQIDILSRLDLVPDLADRFSAVSTALAKWEEPCSPALVHGDFHQGQIVVEADQACLLDWDRAHLGDPACDYGRILGQLQLLDLRGKGDPSAMAEAFATAFVAAGGSRPGARRETFWTVMALLNFALRETRRLRPDWLDRTGGLLDRCDLLLNRRESL